MVYAVKLSKTKYPNWVALLWLSDSEPYRSFVLVTWLFGFAHLWSFKLVCLSGKHAAEVRYKWNDVQDKYKHRNNYRNVGMTGNDGLYAEQEIRRKLDDDGPTLLMMNNFFCFLFFVFGKGDLVKGQCTKRLEVEEFDRNQILLVLALLWVVVLVNPCIVFVR
ncbi:hypothetical protein ACSBR2_026771 [Camellia fascicularis]